ncbi:MAG: hypothetical protein ACK559_10335, partial [bacterium]
MPHSPASLLSPHLSPVLPPPLEQPALTVQFPAALQLAPQAASPPTPSQEWPVATRSPLVPPPSVPLPPVSPPPPTPRLALAACFHWTRHTGRRAQVRPTA